MCGIVGYVGSSQAPEILMDGLKRLEYRGYDSAGIAVHDGKNINMLKAKGKLVNLAEKLKEHPLTGTVGIGHTRWATHGAPSDINSHPHISNDRMIAVVHNGIIENYLDIKEELVQKGYKFVSETDTETVAHLIDYYYTSGMDFFDAVLKMLERIEGAYALGIICRDYPDTIIAARKNAPLVIGKGEGENFIASDIPAILHHTRNVYFLENPQDGKMYEISQRDQLPGGATTRIDHIAYRSSDLEKDYEYCKTNGYKIVSDGIETSLNFWEKGSRCFKIESACGEVIEICQKIK